MLQKVINWFKNLFGSQKEESKTDTHSIDTRSIDTRSVMERSIDELESSLTAIYSEIHKELSHPAKTFTVTFRKKQYYLYHPFDKAEHLKVEKNKRDYIISVVKHVMVKRINKLPEQLDVYDMFRAFTHSTNVENFKVSVSSIDKARADIREKDAIFGKKRPLDESSYQVKNQKRKK